MTSTRNPNPSNLLVVLLTVSAALSLASARFAPADNLLIACGASAPITLPDHRVFLPDSPAHPGLAAASSSHNAKIFARPSSYSFPINSKGFHLLRLHFSPFTARDLDLDLSTLAFHVSAGGFVLLTNFTASAATIKEFLIPVTTDDLVLSFFPARPDSFAFVNAIEVVSTPADLLSDAARLVAPGSPDHVEKIHGLSKQALETVYRLNVGGPKVTPFNDTLWRTWAPDGEVFESSRESQLVSFSGRIAYQKFGASREVAPDNVYNTGRVIKGDSSMNWLLRVGSGYQYLVRMHFCDIASLALNELYFNVYINGNCAYKNFDLSDAAGQVLASPYYVDFVVDANDAGLLNVSIGPSKLSSHSKVDGLLNGLEVMKISNKLGSLAGETTAHSLVGASVGISLGMFIRSVMCGIAFMCLLAMVFLLVARWRAVSRNHVAWTPLPVDAPEGKLAEGNQALRSKIFYV